MEATAGAGSGLRKKSLGTATPARRHFGPERQSQHSTARPKWKTKVLVLVTKVARRRSEEAIRPESHQPQPQPQPSTRALAASVLSRSYLRSLAFPLSATPVSANSLILDGSRKASSCSQLWHSNRHPHLFGSTRQLTHPTTLRTTSKTWDIWLWCS
jgi:hypothetical protein